MRLLSLLIGAVASLASLPNSLVAQSPEGLADAVAVGLAALSVGAKGRIALQVRDSALPPLVAIEASRKLGYPLLAKDEANGPAGVVFIITKTRVSPNEVTLHVRALNVDGERHHVVYKTVMLARQGKEWVVTRKVNRGIS